MERPFRVQQIDHVELYVPSRREAAEWYGKALGLEVLAGYAHWAEDPGGPLMISPDGGSTKLALFRGRPQARTGSPSRATADFHLTAFRVDGAGFLAFLRHLEGLHLQDADGRSVTAAAVRDHGQAYSIYFCDPWGHHLEVTTYDHDHVAAGLPPGRSG